MGEQAATTPGRPRPKARGGTEVLRAAWGFFFIGSSAFNLLVTLPQPEVYRAFAELTFFGWYRDLLLSVALPNGVAITSIVVVLELVAGALMLSSGLRARVGLIGSLVWVVFMLPALGWYSVFGCTPLLVVPLWLLRFGYDRSVVGLVLDRVGRSPAVCSEYIVRPASAEHVEQLPEIEREAATRFGDSLPESVLAHVTSPDSLAAAQEAGLLWVALEPAGGPVGFALASVCERRVHLEELDVLPQHGRKGVGRALVRAVEDYALACDCTEMTLTTFRDVPWNAPFYARMGFEIIPQQELDADLLRRLADESALGLEPSSRVAMRKTLSRRPGTSR